MRRSSCRTRSSVALFRRDPRLRPTTDLRASEFKPSRLDRCPELTGVIWLDPRANALRYLNFDYVNLPIPLRIAITTGRSTSSSSRRPVDRSRWYKDARTERVTATAFGSQKHRARQPRCIPGSRGLLVPPVPRRSVVAASPTPTPGDSATPATLASAPVQPCSRRCLRQHDRTAPEGVVVSTVSAASRR